MSDDPRLLAAHVYDALVQHRRRRVRDGLPIPAGLQAIEDLCRAVRSGQEQSTFAPADVSLDSDAMTKRLLTYGETAAVLSLSMSTIRRVVKAGDLRAIEVAPRNVRIAVEDIDAFIASKRGTRP